MAQGLSSTPTGGDESWPTPQASDPQTCYNPNQDTPNIQQHTFKFKFTRVINALQHPGQLRKALGKRKLSGSEQSHNKRLKADPSPKTSSEPRVGSFRRAFPRIFHTENEAEGKAKELPDPTQIRRSKSMLALRPSSVLQSVRSIAALRGYGKPRKPAKAGAKMRPSGQAVESLDIWSGTEPTSLGPPAMPLDATVVTDSLSDARATIASSVSSTASTDAWLAEKIASFMSLDDQPRSSTEAAATPMSTSVMARASLMSFTCSETTVLESPSSGGTDAERLSQRLSNLEHEPGRKEESSSLCSTPAEYLEDPGYITIRRNREPKASNRPPTPTSSAVVCQPVNAANAPSHDAEVWQSDVFASGPSASATKGCKRHSNETKTSLTNNNDTTFDSQGDCVSRDTCALAKGGNPKVRAAARALGKTPAKENHAVDSDFRGDDNLRRDPSWSLGAKHAFDSVKSASTSFYDPSKVHFQGKDFCKRSGAPEWSFQPVETDVV